MYRLFSPILHQNIIQEQAYIAGKWKCNEISILFVWKVKNKHVYLHPKLFQHSNIIKRKCGWVAETNSLL